MLSRLIAWLIRELNQSLEDLATSYIYSMSSKSHRNPHDSFRPLGVNPPAVKSHLPQYYGTCGMPTKCQTSVWGISLKCHRRPHRALARPHNDALKEEQATIRTAALSLMPRPNPSSNLPHAEGGGFSCKTFGPAGLVEGRRMGARPWWCSDWYGCGEILVRG